MPIGIPERTSAMLANYLLPSDLKVCSKHLRTILPRPSAWKPEYAENKHWKSDVFLLLKQLFSVHHILCVLMQLDHCWQRPTWPARHLYNWQGALPSIQVHGYKQQNSMTKLEKRRNLPTQNVRMLLNGVALCQQCFFVETNAFLQHLVTQICLHFKL